MSRALPASRRACLFALASVLAGCGNRVEAAGRHDQAAEAELRSEQGGSLRLTTVVRFAWTRWAVPIGSRASLPKGLTGAERCGLLIRVDRDLSWKDVARVTALDGAEDEE